MPIARYPRPGKRIAPHSLTEFLDAFLSAPVSGEPGAAWRLRDLDESAWARLGESACRLATLEVMTAVARRIHAIGELRFAVLPDSLDWDSLDLGTRAYNALTRRPGLPRPASLCGQPVAEIMKIKAFGVKSLLDLMVALEDATGLGTVVEGGRENAPPLAKSGNNSATRQTDSSIQLDDVLSRLPAFLKSRLRGIPERLEWPDLAISVRTYRALVLRRAIPRPSALNGESIKVLLSSKNLGRKSLRDLLTALEKATGYTFLARGDATLELADPECSPSRPVSVPIDPLAGPEEKRRTLDLAVGLMTPEEKRRTLHLAVGLMTLEQALGPDVILAKDPRFGPQVRAVAAGCSDTSEVLAILLAKLGRAAPVHEAKLKVLGALCAEIGTARGLGLLAELEGIVRATCADTHAKVVLRFWGWDGRGGATLQQVGDEYGISRERVRQVTKSKREQLEASGPIFAPTATRALAIVQGILPATAATAVDALVRERLVPSNSDLGFLADLGRILGRPTAFRFDDQYGTFVSTRNGEKLVGEVHRQASRLASKYGAACVEDVCDALRRQTQGSPSPELVSRLLRARPDLAWLDDEHRWFCKQPTGSNLLLNRVRKVVSVAGRVRVTELRGGVERDYYLKGSVPPKAILLKLCGHDRALEIRGEVVSMRDGSALEGVLSPPEKTLRTVLLAAGSVLERSQLERDCVAAGLSRPSFMSALTYSPIVIRYAPQVYGLRGIPIPPGAVEAQAPRVSRKGTLLQDSSWAGDGRVRLVYKLTAGSVSNGIVTIPASFTRFLQGDFCLLRLGQPVGTLRCRGSQGWGLGPLFRRVVAEAGDTLTIEIDLQKLEAQASVTTETPEESIAEGPPQ